MEGVIVHMDEYRLTKGHYIICDPGYVIMKNKEGDHLIQKLIKQFYKNMNKFHRFKFQGVVIYVFRSEGGDGIFDGVGTDSGLIAIIETDQLKGDIRFKQDYSKGKIIAFEVNEPIIAQVEHFDLKLSNGIRIHTV